MAAALAGLFFYSSCSPTEKAETKDYTRYVNTFIGAADNGHTFPGACYPFGMIQSRPVYGGGGIMPDVFVPQDTTGVSSYLIEDRKSVV